jgi:glyoxylase-like metal-dependent hydrolase (beta-lactamase superfamily II)
MHEVATGVYRLAVMPFDTINVYLVDDVLVDAGIRSSARRILRALAGRAVHVHAVTNAHPDHQGSSHGVCTRLRLPLWCGAADADVMETGDVTRNYPNPGALAARIPAWLWAGPGHPVSRRLVDGDEVSGCVVIETPGHTPGHIALWRARDRVLIVGDVVFGMHPFTLARGLHEPPAAFTPDVARNRASARRLAALDPAVVCFGHGPAVDGPTFQAFVARLPPIRSNPGDRNS